MCKQHWYLIKNKEKFHVLVFIDIGSLIIKNCLKEKNNFFLTEWEAKTEDMIYSILSDYMTNHTSVTAFDIGSNVKFLCDLTKLFRAVLAC